MTVHDCGICKKTFLSWGAFYWHYPCHAHRQPTPTVVLLGSDNGMRIMFEGALDRARERARELDRAAIYHASVRGERFHNATDPEFLIEHYNDPYWLNVGVPSVEVQE